MPKRATRDNLSDWAMAETCPQGASVGHRKFLEELDVFGLAQLFKPVDGPLARRGGTKVMGVSRGVGEWETWTTSTRRAGPAH